MQSKKDQVLAALPGSARDIIEKTGIGKMAVWNCLELLHEDREIHISEWRRKNRTDGRGRREKVFAAGRGVDATPPVAPVAPRKAPKPSTLLTDEEKMEKREQKAVLESRARALAWADRAAAGITVDPLQAALFGRAR